MKNISAFLLIVLSLQSSTTAAVNLKTCSGKVGGEWNYGRVPAACNASAFGDDRVVYSTYPKLVFMDLQSRTTERNRYTEEMHALLNEAARYYILKRKPAAGAEEVKQWSLLVRLTAAQESRMSHYRVAADSKLKMLRGDSLHGHGMMQLDDRSHFDAIQKGIAWNLITNVTYGMDILFSEWERAPRQSCVGSTTNYAARIRSSWAAYNGGPGSICRWTNSKSAWAANDQGFHALYLNHSWTAYVHDESKAASINVSCLIEKKANCPATPIGEIPTPPPTPTPTPGAQKPQEKQIFVTAAGKYCLFKADAFQCVDEYRDVLCLKSIESALKMSPLNVDDATLNAFPKATKDRHALCRQYDQSLFAVGARALTVGAINLRATAGGGLVGLIPAGESVEILDFEVRNYQVNDRYYKIHSSIGEGFVYGGTDANHGSWLELAPTPVIPPTPAPGAEPVLISKGETIRIVNPVGINLRSVIDNRILIRVPTGTEVVVEEATVSGSFNYISYRVSYGGHSGRIYGGELLPQNTTALWAVRKK